MARAWSESPQDRFDWIFVLTFLVFFPLVWMLTRKRKEVAKADFSVLIALIPSLAGYFFALQAGINALQIISGIAISYSMFWLIYGGQNAYRVLPIFAMLGLGVTSTTYWINYYVDSPEIIHGVIIKFAIAVIFLVWLTLNFLREKIVQTRTLFFAGAVCIGLLFIWQSEETLSKPEAAVILNLTDGKVGPYLGQSQEVTADDIRFFGQDSLVEKFYYVGQEYGIHVLALTCGSKINSVHPASHCLRSAGWTVQSEAVRGIVLNENDFNINEVSAEYRGDAYLFWVWYSNPEISTASFVDFRKRWSSDVVWRTYQVMVPVGEMTEANLFEARRQLRSFLEVVSQR
jgi:hypothetical protein